jgi:hypothetical protein
MNATAVHNNEDVNTSAEKNTNNTNTPPSSSSAVTKPGRQLPGFATTSRHCDLERPFYQLFEMEEQFDDLTEETIKWLGCKVINCRQDWIAPNVSSVHEIRLEHAEKRAEAFGRVVALLESGRWRQESRGSERGFEGMWAFFSGEVRVDFF